jgi:RNA polymerase subunit RPABC4/transcription elongation factor Spt4
MTDPLARFIDPSVVSGVLFALSIGGVGLWLAAAWWTYTDMARRSDSELARLTAAGWVVLSTPALLPLSLAVYALARPQVTNAQRRSRSLAETLGPEVLADDRCSTCGTAVDEAWRRCPMCSTWLDAPCADCGRWSGLELSLCPWCGADGRAEPTVLAPAVETVTSPGIAVMAPTAILRQGLAAPMAPALAAAAAVASSSTGAAEPLARPPWTTWAPGLRDVRRGGRRSIGGRLAADDEPARLGW